MHDRLLSSSRRAPRGPLVPFAPLVLLVALLAPPEPLSAQTWNDATVRALVDRAVHRRASDPARGLADYRARARGFVFFLAQLGEEQLREPPHLVKSDQLALEVYWKAPGSSKQRIVGWRDRVDLPTEIAYHRDHLGVVQHGFRDRIRLGEGQEVRDVPHPLAPDGGRFYEYALTDSARIRLPQRDVRVHEVAFRPTSFDAAGIVGSLYLDADGGELVRMRFTFTRSAYRDPSLEDITILLDNGLWDGRYWLPRRQEIEIRRRTTWLELPARGIIRGRWEIDEYAFDVGLPDTLFHGPEIVAAPRAVLDTFSWQQPLDAAIAAAAGSAAELDLHEVRERVRRVAGGRALAGLKPARPTIGAVSELVRFNRVEGLAVGFGYLVRPVAGATLEARVAWGFGDRRVKGRLEGRYRRGPHVMSVAGERVVQDVADPAVVSPLLNSILAQETGTDYGDYLLRERIRLEFRRDLGPFAAVRVAAGPERTRSLAVVATPARGTFRANPALGAGDFAVAELRVDATRGGRRAGRAAAGGVAIEGGRGEGRAYVRVRGHGDLLHELGDVAVTLAAWGGWGSAELPLHRTFVLGGRGTLLGAPYRAWGGREAAYVRVGVAFPVPAPAIPLGPFASTGRQAVLEPFVAAGWAARPLPGAPWTATEGIEPVIGLALEWFHRLLRLEAGWWPAGGRIGVTGDVRRTLWPIL